jgi:anti-sigma28 factor (negative regulator of flagellin synthesis)
MARYGSKTLFPTVVISLRRLSNFRHANGKGTFLMVDIVSPGLGKIIPRQLPPTLARDGAAPANLPPVNVERIKSLPKLVSLAKELAEQGPPVDFAKIAQVRQAIALGSYRIDPDRIADAIVRFAGKADA